MQQVKGSCGVWVGGGTAAIPSGGNWMGTQLVKGSCRQQSRGSPQGELEAGRPLSSRASPRGPQVSSVFSTLLLTLQLSPRDSFYY